jgi:hypothetical protein
MTTKDIVISQCLEIAALFLLPFLVACMSTTEEFIQGLWYYDNVERLTNPGAYHVPYEDWEEFFFDGGNYRYESCCNRKINDTGRYYVVGIEGNEIVMDLVGETGIEFTDGTQLKIMIIKENGRLKIFGKEWERIYP